MQIEVLSAGQVAALATLVSALVASMTALMVAAINAASARRVAREKDLREYRKSGLEHLLKISDSSTMFFKLVAIHARAKDIKSLEATLDGIEAEKNLTNSIAFMAVVGFNPILSEAAGRFSIRYNDCLTEAVKLHRHCSNNEPVDAERLDQMADTIFHDAFRLRLAAEDFIYESKRSRKELRAFFKKHPQVNGSLPTAPKPRVERPLSADAHSFSPPEPGLPSDRQDVRAPLPPRSS
jgi:hypothetical protein